MLALCWVLHSLRAEAQVTVPAGTVVVLETRGALHSNKLQLGGIVPLLVVADVVVKGEVVVRTGALATAQVTGLAVGRSLFADEFELLLTKVQTADGGLAPLQETRMRFKALRLNEPAVLDPGEWLIGGMQETIVTVEKE